MSIDRKIATVWHIRLKNRSGYTLVELLVASFIGMLAIGAACAGFGIWGRLASDGLQQIQFNAIARIAIQKIQRYIEQASAIRVSNCSRLDLVMQGLKVASLYYQDGDSDPMTASDNVMVFDPDTSVFGDERVICSYVSLDGKTPLFEKTDSGTVKVVLRIGENAVSALSGTGLFSTLHEGVVAKFSVSPRNSFRWFTE